MVSSPVTESTLADPNKLWYPRGLYQVRLTNRRAIVTKSYDRYGGCSTPFCIVWARSQIHLKGKHHAFGVARSAEHTYQCYASTYICDSSLIFVKNWARPLSRLHSVKDLLAALTSAS